MTGKSILHGLSEPLAAAPLISIILVLCGVTLPGLGEKCLISSEAQRQVLRSSPSV